MTYRDRRSAHTPAGKGGSWIRPSTRWAIYHRDGFACAYCGGRSALSIDHLHCVERGGANKPRNLVTSCIRCNSSKQNMTTRAWYALLAQRGHDLHVVRRRVANARRRQIDRVVGRWLCKAPKLDFTIPGLP